MLGGTFNPPHLGHLVMASEAHAQLGLDAVVLVPVAVPPHKRLEDDPGAERRVALCSLAVAGDERLSVSRLEVDRPGPSYTVDTLRALHDAAPDDELTFIIGADNGRSLATWREPEAVLDLATVAVAERGEVDRAAVSAAVAGLRGAERIAPFAMPRIDVSSSDVRRRVREGRPIRYLVPDAVAGAIADGGLYRESVPA